MGLLKSAVCLNEIIECAKDIRREEGTYHYELCIDEEGLNEVYQKLEKMRDDIMDERQGAVVEDG